MTTQVYDILEKIKDQLLEHPSVNTVTSGDLSDVDLTKTSIFPLTHLILKNVTIRAKTLNFDLEVIVMDIVDQTNEISDHDMFYGNDNTQDILNTQLNVVNSIHAHLNRGDLWLNRLQMNGDMNAEPFLERFENVLAGWEATASIEIPNGLNIC